MPTTTLWSAMRRLRRAMTTASPSRSRRSTVRTTSAASEEAVAPRAPTATPTSASASAGASLMPSPTMIVRPARCSSRTASTFSAGVRSARTSSTPMTAPTVCAFSSRSPVTMTMRRMPSRRSWRIVRAASGRIGSSRSSAPTGRAVDVDEDRERTVEAGAPAYAPRPARLRPRRTSSSPCRPRRGGRRRVPGRRGRGPPRRRRAGTTPVSRVSRHGRPPRRGHAARPGRGSRRSAARRRRSSPRR